MLSSCCTSINWVKLKILKSKNCTELASTLSHDHCNKNKSLHINLGRQWKKKNKIILHLVGCSYVVEYANMLGFHNSIRMTANLKLESSLDLRIICTYFRLSYLQKLISLLLHLVGENCTYM